MKVKNEFSISQTAYKVLHTIYYLNDLNFYPNKNGVYKIIHGDIDEETLAFRSCPTFSTVISISSKKISLLITLLIRYDYVKNVYDAKTEEFYLELTAKGKIETSKYILKKKAEYKKKSKVIKPTIVKINKNF